MNCPHCNAQLVVPESAAGTNVTCPKCGGAFPIESPLEKLAGAEISAVPLMSYARSRRPARRDPHRWPYDNRRHPNTRPIGFYFSIWIISFVITLVFFSASLVLDVLLFSSPPPNAPMWVQLLHLATIAAIVLHLWYSLALVGGVVSYGKGRPIKEGLFFGLTMGSVGWIVAALMPEYSDEPTSDG